MTLKGFAYRIYILNRFAKSCEDMKTNKDLFQLHREVVKTPSYHLGISILYYQSIANMFYECYPYSDEEIFHMFLTDLNQTISSYHISEFDYGILADGMSFYTVPHFKTLIKVTRLLINKLREVYVKG